MNPELAWMVAVFWIGRKPRCEVSRAPSFQTVRTALEPIREVWIHDEELATTGFSMMRIMARWMTAATVLA
jgi:hypothetical protein